MPVNPYVEAFPVGSEVQIVTRDALEQFKRDWKLHNRLQDNQLAYAGMLACVAKVGFYHGGDPLYVLEGIPGVWHEACLRGP